MIVVAVAVVVLAESAVAFVVAVQVAAVVAAVTVMLDVHGMPSLDKIVENN